MQIKKLINKTPHPITLVLEEGIKLTLEPDGKPIRLSEKTVTVGKIEYEGVNIPVIKKELLREGIELPPREEGTIYLVSLAVAQAFPNREDFVVVGETVRDENGRIIGASKLGTLSEDWGGDEQ